ncbi:hypothetical protein E9229_002799 [Paeniglutamicibacter cryotolerans]|uniref:Uncharacterized protein n=1 Tax=Paeniglutamicibacter cryotolerans TaxID=670079 RepID=A0A839QTF0_9MICC|nr:hypothetical protein [Paeniglutamicibacter cryotolerans]
MAPEFGPTAAQGYHRPCSPACPARKNPGRRCDPRQRLPGRLR